MEEKKMQVNWNAIQGLTASRGNLIRNLPEPLVRKPEEEGGCGVTGFASSIPVSGRHIIEPSCQMHNRGNGKGGGIAAVGLSPEDLRVPAALLTEDYLLQIAYLESDARPAVEAA